jgi:hypothetical protein
MSLSSASTVAALGMPLSNPCSASAPATTPQLQDVDLTRSKSISLWFATDSPLWFPKRHWRTDAACQQDGCWSVSPIRASLDAANARLRSTAVFQLPRSVGGSEIAACRAAGSTR